MDQGNPTVPSDDRNAEEKEVRLRILLEIFERYVRSVAAISAEMGLSEQLTIETLMAYCLALPEADELILGFLRGDLTMFSLEEQTRHAVERDTRFLELEPMVPSRDRMLADASSGLGRKLAMKRKARGEIPASTQASELQTFIRKNPVIFQDVKSSSHEFLVRWVMLYLMHATKACERGHRVVHPFMDRHPQLRQRIRERISQAPASDPRLYQSRSEKKQMIQRSPRL